MNLPRFIAFLSLIGLSFVSALLFESRMHAGFTVELIVLFIGFVFALIASASILNNESSGWFLATLIFGAALVNSIVLFLMVKSFALLVLSIVVNITGMIFSVLSAAEIDEDDDDDSDDLDLETYDLNESDDSDDSDKEEDYIEVQPEKPKRKYTRRSTSAPKKAAKKTTKRKYTKRK